MKENLIVKRGIRWKLLSVMIGLVIVMLVIFTPIHVFTQKGVLEEELERRIYLMREKLIERGKTISDNLARQTENGVASFNYSNVTEIIKKSVSDEEDLDYAILMDFSGIAYIHTQRPELEQELLSHKEDIFAVSQKKAVINEYEKDGKSYMEFIVPIYVSANQWGVLRLGFSLDLLNYEITNSKKEILNKIRSIIVRSTIASIIFVFMSAVIVYVISNRLSKPIVSLTEIARELSKDNFHIVDNIKIKSGDEIGILADTFIEMSRNLKRSYGELEDYSRTLKQKVEDRTIELRNANKKLQEQDKVKTDFLSIVSHELRTPLALVLGFARIISKRLEDVVFPNAMVDDTKVQKAINQVKENVNIIMLEGKRLTSLINDLLDISKMEAGKIVWEMDLLSMAEVIERAVAATACLFEEKGLKLIRDIEIGLPVVMGDRNRLIQVVINLISNAVNFTAEGSVTCRAKKYDGKIIISIIDTGAGINKVDQEKVFEKFRQVGARHTGKQKGTGLGLPICKQIVEHHGGKIWVESELRGGSVFSFTLPCSIRNGEEL
ncbi:MAG: ATP-binding protein [Candidatus Scalinduaceae bacterium]